MAHGSIRSFCKCIHEYQDKLYGKNIRVMNATEKGSQDKIEVRCTVCKTVHTVNKSQVK